MKTKSNQQGFTLVELAIVLVIIGLIIGGVLVGQDLIKAAEIRATVTQMEKTNAAVNTFRGKYNGMPGDLLAAQANQFAIVPSTVANRPGSDGAGDGDGLMENGPTAANKQGLGFETRAFWSDLTQADLIADNVTPLTEAALAATAYADSNALLTAAVLPSSKLRKPTFIHVYSLNGRNYYYLGGISAVASSGVLTLAPGVSPLEASSIDDKMDDGSGGSGIVGAVLNITTATAPLGGGTKDDGSAGTAAFGEAADCFSAASGTYNSSKANGASINCRLSIRTSF